MNWSRNVPKDIPVRIGMKFLDVSGDDRKILLRVLDSPRGLDTKQA